MPTDEQRRKWAKHRYGLNTEKYRKWVRQRANEGDESAKQEVASWKTPKYTPGPPTKQDSGEFWRSAEFKNMVKNVSRNVGGGRTLPARGTEEEAI